MAQRGRPGGGLGAPEETPDPLHRYRGFILGGLAVALALGVFYVVTRPKPAIAVSAVTGTRRAESKRTGLRTQSAGAVAPSRNGDRLLDALKEELFQLEMERHQGTISAEEYEKAKAALDTTIARAAKRGS
jgi:hypothetical protein